MAIVDNLDDALEAIEDSMGEDVPYVPEGVGHLEQSISIGVTGHDMTPRQQALVNELKAELEENDDLDFTTTEDVQAAIERRRENRELLVDRINGHRLQKQEHCFDIAESWAKKPDLSVEERCHGVAWEIQKNYGDTFGVDAAGEVIVADVGTEYGQLYDAMNHDKIRDGLVRSAASLFT